MSDRDPSSPPQTPSAHTSSSSSSSVDQQQQRPPQQQDQQQPQEQPQEQQQQLVSSSTAAAPMWPAPTWHPQRQQEQHPQQVSSSTTAAPASSADSRWQLRLAQLQRQQPAPSSSSSSSPSSSWLSTDDAKSFMRRFDQIVDEAVANPWWPKNRNHPLECRMPGRWQDVVRWYWTSPVHRDSPKDEAADDALRLFIGQNRESVPEIVAGFIELARFGTRDQVMSAIADHIDDARCVAMVCGVVMEHVAQLDRLERSKKQVIEWWRRIAGRCESRRPYTIKAHLWRSEYDMAADMASGERQEKQQASTGAAAATTTYNSTSSSTSGTSGSTTSSSSASTTTSSSSSSSSGSSSSSATRPHNRNSGTRVLTRELTADEVGCAEFELQEDEVLEITLTDGLTWLGGDRTMFVRDVELQLARKIINIVNGFPVMSNLGVTGPQGGGKTMVAQFVAWMFTVGSFADRTSGSCTSLGSSGSSGSSGSNGNETVIQSTRPAICMYFSEELQFVLFPDGVARLYPNVRVSTPGASVLQVGFLGFIEFAHDDARGNTVVACRRCERSVLQAGQHRVLLLSDMVVQPDRWFGHYRSGSACEVPFPVVTVVFGRPIKKLFSSFSSYVTDGMERLRLWSLRELLAVAPLLAPQIEASLKKQSSNKNNNNNNSNNINNNSNNNNNNNENNPTVIRTLSELILTGDDVVRSTIISRFVQFGGVLPAIMSGDEDGDLTELCRWMETFPRTYDIAEQDAFDRIAHGFAVWDDWPSQARMRPLKLPLVNFVKHPSTDGLAASGFASMVLMHKAMERIQTRDDRMRELFYRNPMRLRGWHGPAIRRWTAGVLLSVVHEWGMHSNLVEPVAADGWRHKYEFKPMRRKLVLFGDKFTVNPRVYYLFIGVPESAPLSSVFIADDIRDGPLLYGEVMEISTSVAMVQAAMAYLKWIAEEVDGIKGVRLLLTLPGIGWDTKPPEVLFTPTEVFIGTPGRVNADCRLVDFGVRSRRRPSDWEPPAQSDGNRSGSAQQVGDKRPAPHVAEDDEVTQHTDKRRR